MGLNIEALRHPGNLLTKIRRRIAGNGHRVEPVIPPLATEIPTEQYHPLGIIRGVLSEHNLSLADLMTTSEKPRLASRRKLSSNPNLRISDVIDQMTGAIFATTDIGSLDQELKQVEVDMSAGLDEHSPEAQAVRSLLRSIKRRITNRVVSSFDIDIQDPFTQAQAAVTEDDEKPPATIAGQIVEIMPPEIGDLPQSMRRGVLTAAKKRLINSLAVEPDSEQAGLIKGTFRALTNAYSERERLRTIRQHDLSPHAMARRQIKEAGRYLRVVQSLPAQAAKALDEVILVVVNGSKYWENASPAEVGKEACRELARRHRNLSDVYQNIEVIRSSLGFLTKSQLRLLEPIISAAVNYFSGQFCVQVQPSTVERSIAETSGLFNVYPGNVLTDQDIKDEQRRKFLKWMVPAGIAVLSLGLGWLVSNGRNSKTINSDPPDVPPYNRLTFYESPDYGEVYRLITESVANLSKNNIQDLLVRMKERSPQRFSLIMDERGGVRDFIAYPLTNLKVKDFPLRPNTIINDWFVMQTDGEMLLARDRIKFMQENYEEQYAHIQDPLIHEHNIEIDGRKTTVIDRLWFASNLGSLISRGRKRGRH